MLVYKITNKINGKIYIGKTQQTVAERWKGHVHSARKYAHTKRSSHFYNAIVKYGPDNFTQEIIATVSGGRAKDVLNDVETFCIALYDTRNPEVGYNICRGGEGRTAPLSSEEKTKLRENNIRYWDNLNNLIGETFGRLTVISRAEKRKSGGRKLWNCQCSCGGTSTVTTHALKSGGIRSCGCLITDAGRKRWAKLNLTGQVFGKLTVQHEAEHYRSQRQWTCLCSCGNRTTVRTNSLRSGNTKSCGVCDQHHVDT